MKQYTFSYIVAYIAAIILFPAYGMDIVVYDNDCLKNQPKKRKISLGDLKKYQHSLEGLQCMHLSRREKENLKELLKKTKESIAIKEAQLDLKEIVADIRTNKTADIEELRIYQRSLHKYIKLLPDSYSQKKEYKNTLRLVTKRISVLTEIDYHLAMDYGFFDTEDLEGVVQDLIGLQKILNKPDSERQKLLTEKIDHLQTIIENDSCFDIIFS